MGHPGKLRVLILDAHVRQALPFLRSIKRAGHRVSVACPYKICPGYFSRYADTRYLVPECHTAPERFAEEILKLLRVHEHHVTLPFGHHTMLWCVKHKRELEQYTSVPVADEEVFLRAFDKGRTMRFCMDQGIPCPVTYFPEEEDLESILARTRLPIWMKPCIGIGAIGGRRLDTPEEVRQHYPAYRAKYGPMILQDFVPHEGAQQMVFHTFLDGDARMCAGMLSIKPRYVPLRGGTSTVLVLVRHPEVVAHCRRLFEGLGLTGIADADLIVDPRDGRANVIEINPRVSCSIKMGFAAGVDYADMWLRLATGRPIEPKLGYPAGIQLRNLCQDILWYLLSDRKARRETDPPFFRFLGSDVHYQTIASDDPAPFFGFVLDMFRKYSDPSVRAAWLGHEGRSSSKTREAPHRKDQSSLE